MSSVDRHAKAAALFTVAVGFVVLLGWILDQPLLKSVLSGTVSMKVNTAVCLMALGTALWCLRDTEPRSWVRRTGCGLALLAALVGLMTFGEYVGGRDLGIDQILIRESPAAPQTSNPGRMAPTTSLSFFLLGMALLFSEVRLTVAARVLLFPPALFSSLAVVGYVYGLPALYGVAPYTSMAVHTAATLFVACLGFVFARPSLEIVPLLVSDTVGGVMLRRVLPYVVAIPLLLGLVRLEGERRGFYGPEFAVVLLVVSCIFFLSIVLWGNARFLNRFDAERLQAERQQHGVETRFKVMLESALDCIIAIDSAGAVVEWNPAAEKTFGYSRAQVLGKTLAELIVPPGLRERHYQGLKRYLETGEAPVLNRRLELSALRSDGSEFPVELTIVKMELEAASIFIGFVRDITEQKRAQEEIQKRERQFLHLFAANPVPMWVYDLETLKILEVNESAVAKYGYRSDEFLGLTIADLRPSGEVSRLLEDVTKARPPLQHSGEWRHRLKDGRVIDVEIVSHEVDYAGRRAALVVAYDVTLRKQAEEAMRKMNEELERRVKERTAELEAANQELEAFSYSVSHDLRAPLRAIDGFSRILVDSEAARLSEEGREHLGLVRKAAQQMGQLIDDLLSFARASRQALARQVIAFEDLVSECLAALKEEQVGREIGIVIHPLPKCEADPRLFKQVWMNLLSNALKFTRRQPRPVIEIGSRSENGSLIFYVKDNGTGFDMKYAHKLFGVFQRLHRADEFEGTGVGLAIVQRIVHRHGGKVWAEAEPGKGATFYFSLERRS